MSTPLGGNVLFLDRSDINTDEIIPARYLSEVTKEALGPHLLEDLSLPGFDPRRDLKGVGAIVTRANFGCGSSREHAPWALEVNGIRVVLAESFARIFRQNMFNGGMLAIGMPPETIAHIFAHFGGANAHLAVDLEQSRLRLRGAQGREEAFAFVIEPFDRELVRSGGWVPFAAARYLQK
jgi:3-isopropylmalate/(R)-2-methylmalate dehydratase small subunit